MKKNGRKQVKKAEGKKSKVKKDEGKKVEAKKNEIKKSELKKNALRKEKDPRKWKPQRRHGRLSGQGRRQSRKRVN